MLKGLTRLLDRPVAIWVCVILVFLSGVVFSFAFVNGVTASAVGQMLGYLGSIATLVAALVATSAVQDWKSQFRHSEKYSSLKTLKVVSDNLRSYRGLVSAMEQRHLSSMMNAGAEDQEAVRREGAARSAWILALQSYSSAWTNAAVFLSEEELSCLDGNPFDLAGVSQDGILKLTFQYANSPSSEHKAELIEVGRSIKVDFNERFVGMQERIDKTLKANI